VIRRRCERPIQQAVENHRQQAADVYRGHIAKPGPPSGGVNSPPVVCFVERQPRGSNLRSDRAAVAERGSTRRTLRVSPVHGAPEDFGISRHVSVYQRRIAAEAAGPR
jgi:hypothetical protein